MVATPAAMPITCPFVPTLAVAMALLLQVPPVVASLRIIVSPAHTVVGPVMGATAYEDKAVNRATIKRV